MFKKSKESTLEILIGALVFGVLVFSVSHFLKTMVNDSQISVNDIIIPAQAATVAIEDDLVPLASFPNDVDGIVQSQALGLEYAINTSMSRWNPADEAYLTDNIGGSYKSAMTISPSGVFNVELNKKYSVFSGTIYVRSGYDADNNGSVLIENNGKVVYSSPEINKNSAPIHLNVDISNCDEFRIVYKSTSSTYEMVFFGDCVFK